MAPELSSNWKKLQATIKKESESSSSAQKRKREPPTERQLNSAAAKRRRIDEGYTKGKESSTSQKLVKGQQRRTVAKMGSWLSRSTTEEKGSTTTTNETTTKTTTTTTLPDPFQSLSTWASDNDISAADLAAAYGTTPSTSSSSISILHQPSKDLINSGLIPTVQIGKYISLDCEMVGVGPAPSLRSSLARVSITNFHGLQIYDSYVRPQEYVTDWRTHVSGISPKHMHAARTFEEVQRDVAGILEGRILVGHALRNDLEVLMLSHPKRDMRDTARLKGFRRLVGGRTPSLRVLAREVLGVEIQGGEHSSLEDARVAMALFRRRKSEFDVQYAEKVSGGTVEGKLGKGRAGTKKKKKGKR